MRHRVAGRKLSRTSEHRLALRRNLVSSLFEHETISTTIEKAKEVKPFAEKLITLAKKGTLQSRRRAISLLGNRAIVAQEEGDVVNKGTVIAKLFSELGPRYLDRPGGYTRIIRLAQRRLGDNGQLVLLQLVGENDKRTQKTKSRKTARASGKTDDDSKQEKQKPTTEAVEEQPQTVVSDENVVAAEESQAQTTAAVEEPTTETTPEETNNEADDTKSA